MKQIIVFNSLPLQTHNIVLEDNTQFTITLQFIDNQVGWYFSLTYNTLTINGKRLINSPNILRQYKNLIPFGLSVVTNDFTDPYAITDFTSNRVLIYLLNATDVLALESSIF